MTGRHNNYLIVGFDGIERKILFLHHIRRRINYYYSKDETKIRFYLMFMKVILITKNKALDGLLFRILNIVHCNNMHFGVSAFPDELKQQRPVFEVFRRVKIFLVYP